MVLRLERVIGQICGQWVNPKNKNTTFPRKDAVFSVPVVELTVKSPPDGTAKEICCLERLR